MTSTWLKVSEMQEPRHKGDKVVMVEFLLIALYILGP